MTNIEFLNIICSYFVFFPIIYFALNYKNLIDLNNSIFVYLLLCLFAETIYLINHLFFLENTNSFTLLFLIIELVVLYKLFKEYFNSFLSKIFIALLIIYFSLTVFQIFNIYTINYSIFLGGNKLIILLMSVNVLLESFKREISVSTKILNISFLQYSLIGVTIYSFASFFIQNKEYVFFYILINSISNFTLYLLITYSMYICKKQSLQV